MGRLMNSGHSRLGDEEDPVYSSQGNQRFVSQKFRECSESTAMQCGCLFTLALIVFIISIVAYFETDWKSRDDYESTRCTVLDTKIRGLEKSIKLTAKYTLESGKNCTETTKFARTYPEQWIEDHPVGSDIACVADGCNHFAPAYKDIALDEMEDDFLWTAVASGIITVIGLVCYCYFGIKSIS